MATQQEMLQMLIAQGYSPGAALEQIFPGSTGNIPQPPTDEWGNQDWMHAIQNPYSLGLGNGSYGYLQNSEQGPSLTIAGDALGDGRNNATFQLLQGPDGGYTLGDPTFGTYQSGLGQLGDLALRAGQVAALTMGAQYVGNNFLGTPGVYSDPVMASEFGGMAGNGPTLSPDMVGGGLTSMGDGSAVAVGGGAAATGGAAAAGGATGGSTAAAGGAAGSGLLSNISNPGAVLGAVGGLAEALSAPDSQTNTQTRSLDPRLDPIIFGPNGGVQAVQDAFGQPLPSGIGNVAGVANDYLNNGAADDLGTTRGVFRDMALRQTAAPQMTAAQSAGAAPIQAPTLGSVANPGAAQAAFVGPQGGGGSASGGRAAAQQMQAAQINAPGQNQTNLSPFYQDMLYGDPAQNPYLQGALERGATQARSTYTDLLDDMSTRFNEDILGSIRGNAVQSGNIGSSRQAMAENIAARELAKQAARTAERLGVDTNQTMIGAQAGAFESGRNRAVNVANPLSQNQYGVATNNAGFQQGAGQTNATLGTNASIATAGNQTQASVANSGANNSLAIAAMNAANSMNQFNAGAQNQGNQFYDALNSGRDVTIGGWQYGANTNNAQLGQQNNQFNANLMQNAGVNNLNSQITTNNQNIGANQWGATNLGNLPGAAAQWAQQPNNHQWNQINNASAALQPWAQMTASGSSTQPLYNNPWAGAVGGAQVGGTLWNMF